jgi:drug/metabolite transporter (DMT)-like permease
LAATTGPVPPVELHRISSPVLAWFFVVIWGSGYVATRLGLQFAPPFTFLTLRFAFGAALLVPLVLIFGRRAALRWPGDPASWFHIIVAGLLMHVVNLGGSHYAQYLGMSAGITALILAAQPLLTAVVMSGLRRTHLTRLQWIGVVSGLLGVALVVWHKIDVHAMTAGALAAALVALLAVTVATLYQRHFCPAVDLRAASAIQFCTALLVLAPLARVVEGFPVRFDWKLPLAVAYLVIFASILAVNALHVLMRRGEATRVTSLFYLTPLIAMVLEWVFFGVRPTMLTWIGVAVTCGGVALVVRSGRHAERGTDPAGAVPQARA